jgi:hypothetical protein
MPINDKRWTVNPLSMTASDGTVTIGVDCKNSVALLKAEDNNSIGLAKGLYEIPVSIDHVALFFPERFAAAVYEGLESRHLTMDGIVGVVEALGTEYIYDPKTLLIQSHGEFAGKPRWAPELSAGVPVSKSGVVAVSDQIRQKFPELFNTASVAFRKTASGLSADPVGFPFGVRRDARPMAIAPPLSISL